MYRWKREYRTGVVFYQLYRDGVMTKAYVMRENGRSGSWIGRIGASKVTDQRLLRDTKAILEAIEERWVK
jgi:hypothetical protein